MYYILLWFVILRGIIMKNNISLTENATWKRIKENNYADAKRVCASQWIVI